MPTIELICVIGLTLILCFAKTLMLKSCQRGVLASSMDLPRRDIRLQGIYLADVERSIGTSWDGSRGLLVPSIWLPLDLKKEIA